ncbi:hypothetical protein E4U30_006358 [Claviceps sp. LM220 group G6]|nr:hypothetical protein E4U30_006358 [Claviceps sp. LM220 group G6]
MCDEDCEMYLQELYQILPRPNSVGGGNVATEAGKLNETLEAQQLFRPSSEPIPPGVICDAHMVDMPGFAVERSQCAQSESPETCRDETHEV